MIPTSIDGTDITGATIDGTDVQEITVDGQTVFTAGPDVPFPTDLHLRYDFANESGSTPITDTTGNGHDLTGSYSGVSRSINGVQAGEFDGSSDRLETTFSSLSTPFSIFIVVDFDVNQNQIFINGTSSGTASFDNYTLYDWTDSAGEWRLYMEGVISGGNPDTNPHIIGGIFDSTQRLRVDGTEIGTATNPTAAANGISVGGRSDGSFLTDGLIGEVLFYDDNKNANVSQIETYLSNRWGVTI